MMIRPLGALALMFAAVPVSVTAGKPVVSSVGDAVIAPLMDALLAAYRAAHPDSAAPMRWSHRTDAVAIGALMFELAELAPLAREPDAGELAPYDHQFRGDMMKAPLLVRIALIGERPAYVAVNKRPGAPLPDSARRFLEFALGSEGQRIAARTPGFKPLPVTDLADELAKLGGFVATLDPALPPYTAHGAVSGEVRSDGSDGMKSLMDRWMRDFRLHQPGVTKGERWEHFGTLNGFHALLTQEADIAPMGRELWPQELDGWRATFGPGSQPIEIRVARGGFNTPQRTTAQAVFVHRDNPLAGISLPQLAAIMGERPSITRWGQLGLDGEWAERAIHVYMPPAKAPNAMSMQIMVLGGRGWTADARQASIAETAAAIARDPGAIGFGGFEEGGSGIVPLAVAADNRASLVPGNYESVSSGRYPLTRYMYIRLNRPAGGPIPPQVKEFLRFVLSREGQDPVRFSGYFPLAGTEAEAELAKLDE